MYFRRRPREYREFRDTPRKRQALARRQARERDALPLFADQIAADQPDADTVMAERAAVFARVEQQWRASFARDWRRGRAWLRSLPAEDQAKLLRHWNSRIYPGDPTYFLGMLHSYTTGALDLDNFTYPSWRVSA